MHKKIGMPTYAVRNEDALQFSGQNTSNPLIRVRKMKPTIATYRSEVSKIVVMCSG